MTSVSEVEGTDAPDDDRGLLAERQRVGEVAVVGDGEAAWYRYRRQSGWHVLERRLAGGGVALWPMAIEPLRRLNDGGVVEVVADEAEVPLGVELLAVVG